MSRFRYLFIFLIILLTLTLSAQSELPPTFQPAPRPMPSSLQLRSGIRLEYYFTSLTQGGSGLLRLTGAGIKGAQLEILGARQPFFTFDDRDWYALLAVDMESRPGAYDLNVIAQRESDTVTFTRSLPVEQANFILQEFDLPADRAYLVDPAVEQAEFEALAQLTAGYSSEPLWDAAGFELPMDTPLTSPFGSFRVLNGARQTRHTGWDQNAPPGTPVHALAAGVLVFAGPLEIRGNYALIDHGIGIYSGYAHFSDLFVQAGQPVAAGQIIGSSGDSGRSSGPHLHWEIVAQGKWLDGLTLLDLWLPS